MSAVINIGGTTAKHEHGRWESADAQLLARIEIAHESWTPWFMPLNEEAAVAEHVAVVLGGELGSVDPTEIPKGKII